jgi:hypothetical protein
MHKFITKATKQGKMTEQTMATDTNTQSIDHNMIARMAELVNQLGGNVKDMQGWLKSRVRKKRNNTGTNMGHVRYSQTVKGTGNIDLGAEERVWATVAK